MPNYRMAGLGGPIDDAAKKLARDLIARSVNRVEFFTAYTKPSVFSGQDLANIIPLGDGGAPPSTPPGPKSRSLGDRIKPTLVIESPFGRRVIAPFGEATPDEHRKNLRNLMLMGLGVLAVYGAGFYYLGYRAGRRG